MGRISAETNLQVMSEPKPRHLETTQDGSEVVVAIQRTKPELVVRRFAGRRQTDFDRCELLIYARAPLPMGSAER